MVDPNQSSSLIAYSNHSHDIPCGILKGNLTTNFQVEWDISNALGTGIVSLVYMSSQGNITQYDASGRFSYSPVTSDLTVANFLGYGNSSVQITCIVIAVRTRISRTITVNISYGKHCCSKSTA